MYKTMTPGPTNVRENVRMARSLETTIRISIRPFVSSIKKPVIFWDS